MVQTAVNLNTDEIRRKKWTDDRPLETACANISNFDPTQDEVFDARERLRLVKEALDEMPPRTRTIFLQHRLDGMKYREIAEAAGISQSAVEKHIARAVQFLAERVQDE